MVSICLSVCLSCVLGEGKGRERKEKGREEKEKGEAMLHVGLIFQLLLHRCPRFEDNVFI